MAFSDMTQAITYGGGLGICGKITNRLRILKWNLKTLFFGHPVISFCWGFAFALLLVLYPFILAAIVIISGIAVYAFKDRIDFKEILTGQSTSHLTPCKECGSRTKHKKWCSFYKTKKGKGEGDYGKTA